MRWYFMALAGTLWCVGVAVAKSGPTLHTREEIARVRVLCRTEPWAIKQRDQAVAGAARWVTMTDDALWDFIPDANLPRALNVNFGVGCPVHGKKVFQKGGHYPWLMSTDKPFKVTCPIGGEVYPSNDFQAYLESGRKDKLDTHTPYVDDGFGYIAPDGQRYWFVAHYVFWQRWRHDVFGAMDALAQAYLLTGQPEYAHKLAVMLARIIEVYPTMDYATQAYHNGQWPARIHGRVLDYIWENSTITRLARCYDAIYDAIDSDAKLNPFSARHGIDDFKRQFEQKVLHFMARDIMAGRIRGNMYYQPTLARLAIVIDNNDPSYGPTPKQMVDWLLQGGGEIEFILYNGFDRDGAGGESAPGYSSAWNDNFCQVADLLIRLGVDVTRNPRWRQVIRFPYNVTIINSSPRIGDCGGTINGAPKMIDTVVAGFGYKHFRDPQCAQLLLGQKGVFRQSLWGEALDRSDVEKVAASAPDLTDLRTRSMGGYGLAVFDTGRGAARRAAYMYYGSPDAWHGHHDRLTIGYITHDLDLLPEMGYPSHWNDKGERFTRGMPSHYIVEIDQKRSANKGSGYLDFFAAGSRARVMRAHAEAIYPGAATIYRRTVAMIDGAEASFLVDLFHVRGGALQDYHFHGLPFGAFSTEGLAPVSTQAKGTLLGEQVAWGKDATQAASGYDFLRNVRRYRADGLWWARWVGRQKDHLTYWMPACGEVIVCDGEPPAKPNFPETMEFVVVRQRADESRFPAVIAPSIERDFVTSVEIHQAPGKTHYRVNTSEGVWNVIVGDDGAFESVLNSPDGAGYAFFANRTDVEFDGKRFRHGGPHRLTVQAVDYASNTITVRETIPKPERLVGQVCVIGPRAFASVEPAPPLNSGSYTVSRATAHELQFEGPAITGRIVVDTLADTKLTTKTRLTGYGTQMFARQVAGAALVGEDLKQAAPIVAYGDPGGVATFTLGEPRTFPDADGDGRRFAYLADIAPNYVVTFAPWIEITRLADGTITTKGNGPIEAR